MDKLPEHLARMLPNNRTPSLRRLNTGLRRKRGERNKTEAAWEEELGNQRLEGHVHSWWFEPFTLRLSHPETGQPQTYTPDFMVLATSGEVFIDDVKGNFTQEAARVRIKAAAEIFPLWRFRLVVKLPKKAGGGWKLTEV